MKNLKPDSEFDGMYYKALARSHADYIFGMNLSRAYTLSAREKGLDSVYSIGRVQTPVLGLIVRRYLANKNHKESFYYNLNGNFAFGANQVNTNQVNAKLVITDNIPTDPNSEKEKRIIEKSVSEAIKIACENALARFHHAQSKIKARQPLYLLLCLIYKLKSMINTVSPLMKH